MFSKILVTLLFSSCVLGKTISIENGTQAESRRQFVREMMLDSWNAYVQYAWGHEALDPFERTAFANKYGNNSGYTLVTAMSTLWTMGLKDEFEKGREWIESKLDLSTIDEFVNTYEVLTHYVGGLLSCYALTKDTMFLNKATQIAKWTEPNFNTSTGLPRRMYPSKLRSLSMSAKLLEQFTPLYYSSPFLSDVGGFQLEFNYLSDVSGDSQFRDKITQIRKVLKEIGKPKNLYYRQINVNGTWIIPNENNTDSTPFDLAVELYKNLIKSYIQSNGKDVQAMEMYKEAIDAMDRVKMFDTVSPTGQYYVRQYNIRDDYLYNTTLYDACQLGAMLSRGAKAINQTLSRANIEEAVINKEQIRVNRHLLLAEKITEACMQVSNSTATGLGPNRWYFNLSGFEVPAVGYFLDPDLAESYFVLWRLTHEPKYRDYAWQLAKAIREHARIETGGYGLIKDVNKVPTTKTGHQIPSFLSATLKYLYLTFADDDVLPLDQWVFNAQGHPLPICGKNAAYPEEKCKF